ncbi:Phage terminase-like protein, large subunit, contains N-terminal HTH domain [Rhodoblastus acidophilus]|uniref:Phage terminase-like protein, large subunit, contains N-terminal HTH domain n=1 Tax=Rhodoblastus acidophilus TaxID=1074 RepID=A0A212R0L9_RHOAC|nr:Phage terminase-like protein, large subunit, contains N-terminal HTH domain [Rhodoblastus acidophilus]
MRTACIWIPRGNAKTTLASALALAHFMGPEAEAGGQVVQAAADRENAGIAFKHSWEMVKQDRALSARVSPVESRKLLNHPKTSSVLKAISSEAYSKHGMNVSFFLADEVHAWAPAEARKLFKTVQDSMVKREHPLSVIISTAGEGTGGLAWDLWDYSHKVASGEIEDPSFAPIIFAAPAEADWRDEAAWHAANPAIEAGFCSLEELRIKARRIEHFPSEIADFRRFHLNQWQEGAAQPWVALELYDACEPMPDRADLLGRTCWVGVDLSSVEDLTAVVAVFPSEGENGKVYDVLPMFFLPEAGLARKAERDRADYVRWRESGVLKVTEGNVIDHKAVVEHVAALAEDFDVQEIAIDRWNSTAVNVALQEEGFTVAQFGQGFASMAAPVKELKRAILSGSFRHGANPLLRMCFANVVAETDAAENEKFTKERARGRIDGAVASAMAVGRILATDEGPCVYETEERPDGFLWV